MKTWIIEPRDSLIVRDGRPFGVRAGTHATSLDFPFPSTTTGGARTRAGLDKNGIFNTSLIDAVKGIGVSGPLLVELNDNGEISDWLLPSPSDALLMNDENNEKIVQIRRLVPIEVSSDWMNLKHGLAPVGAANTLKGKPLGDPPRYWSWNKKLRGWLVNAEDSSIEIASLEVDVGHSGPEKDTRVHASLNESFTTGVTGENNLFQTRGLEFRRRLRGYDQTTFNYISAAKRMALAVFVSDNEQGRIIAKGIAPLGGERRLVAWRHDAIDATKEILHCPGEIKTRIIESGCCRLLLLTPAFFKQGSYPEWLLQSRQGITLDLKSIAHGRYQVVSGWDFARVNSKNGKQVFGEPKPTRRLVPSGAVLFIRLGGDKQRIADWIDDTWLKCVSDDDPTGKQDFRRDGFGLSVLGTWDRMQMNLE